MTQLHADDGGQHLSSRHPGEHPAHFTQPNRPLCTDAVFGTIFFEVLVHPGSLPSVPGWTLRLWSQARLGDATLEARADGAQTADELIAGLGAQGIRALGPVRHRRS